MKFIVLFVSICISLVGFSQQQVINGGFEEINPNLQLPEDPYPDNWYAHHRTIIWQQYPCLFIPFTGEVTNESHSGEWAIKMETKGCNGEHVIPGGYYLGALDPELPIFYANVYTSRPESFSFFYKFNGVDGDSAQYAMSLLKYDSITPGLSLSERIDTVGFVNGYLSQNIDSYTQFIAPIEYLSENSPSYISMGFLSGVGCLSDNCSEGTTLWVDQIELIGESLNVNEELLESVISVYPNPAQDQITVQLIEPQGGNIETLQILDLSGRTVAEYPWGNGVFDLTGLANGLYLLQVLHDGKPVSSEKLVVQHH